MEETTVVLFELPVTLFLMEITDLFISNYSCRAQDNIDAYYFESTASETPPPVILFNVILFIVQRSISRLKHILITVLENKWFP